jgi:O-antigen biosynthesis protein
MSESLLESAADLIIPVRNNYFCTRNLIEGIYRYSDIPFHIYVIDNASTDETRGMDKVYTRNITIVHNRENRGWCGAINQGIKLGQNPYAVFMKNDVEVSQGWLGNMISFLDTHPKIGAVGPLDSSPGDWQCVDKVREKLAPQIPQFLTEDLHERNRILKYHFQRAGILVDDMLAFFCMALRRRTIDTVGFLDESMNNGHQCENYCRRLRKSGFVLGLSLDTYVIHHGKEPERRKRNAAPSRNKTAVADSRV